MATLDLHDGMGRSEGSRVLRPRIPYSDWDFLKDFDQRLANRILKEYSRVKGQIPYEPGYVYIIQAVGSKYFKIGKSICPDKRILQISPQMPFKTRSVRVWRSQFMTLAEKWMHSHFGEFRTNGEWFELPDKELYHLFSGVKIGYDEAIKYAYAIYFCACTEIDFRDLNDYLAREFGPKCGLSLFGGNEHVIAWIEDLFEQIYRLEFASPVPEDIRAKVQRVRQEELQKSILLSDEDREVWA